MLQSQNLIPLTSGAYQARNAIGNYLVCDNLFPETNPQEATPDVPATHYPREGKRLLSAPSDGAQGWGRGVFAMSNGALYAVLGEHLYYVDPDWNWNKLGKIAPNSTPVSMSDNGTTAVLVDGTQSGYQVDLGTNTFSQIADPTGLFVGSPRVDFADTYFGFSMPGTNKWYLSLSNQVAFNALVQAGKDSAPDPIMTLAFNLRQAWLIGSKSSEVWFLAGSTPFPYQEWPNTFVPYGTCAPYSLVQADVDLFWLSRNPQGQAIAVKTSGFRVEAISTRALEWIWSNYANVSDVIGGTFQQAGHTFIVFHFPSADATWAYDLTTKQWHKRTYIDNNGKQHRELTAFYASVGSAESIATSVSSPAGAPLSGSIVYPKTIIGQGWANGEIYALDPSYYTDNGQPIVMKRSFPHQVQDMKFITHAAFVADFATGGIEGYAEGSPFGSDFNGDFGSDFGGAAVQGPAVGMRVSNDGGNTWGNTRLKGLVTSGHYRSMMRWRGTGMARDRVYELTFVYPGPCALNGGYLEPIPHGA